jgi:hypothetical protein
MNSSGRAKRSKIAPLSRAVSAPPTVSAEGAAPHAVARLVALDQGFYAFSFAAETIWRETVAGLALPVVQVCAPPHPAAAAGGAAQEAVEIIDGFGRAGSWLGELHRVLFVKSPAGGGAVLITGYLTGDPDSMKLELEICRVVPPAPVLTLTMGGPASAGRSPRVGLDVVAHIRGRGDIRFRDTPWIGRLGPGLWIEAFTLVAPARSAAAAIEYKGLAAGGAETPWIDTGGPCGARGLPLIGFAVRQKSGPGGALFDCEYTGYFQSGAEAGPARNGAPCRSAIANDPLEGMQLRITARPARPGRIDLERARHPASETPTRRPIA